MLKQRRNNGVEPNPLLTDNKTRKSAYILFAALYFIQSVGDPTSGLVSQPVRSLLRNWGESPASLAALMALLAIPWSIKPAFGLLSDFVPLLGCRRRKRRHHPRSSQSRYKRESLYGLSTVRSPRNFRSAPTSSSASFTRRSPSIERQSLQSRQPISRVPRSSISIKVALQRLHFPRIMPPNALYPSPYAQSNPRLATIGELNASSF